MFAPQQKYKKTQKQNTVVMATSAENADVTIKNKEENDERHVTMFRARNRCARKEKDFNQIKLSEDEENSSEEEIIILEISALFHDYLEFKRKK